jgi:hypothetical protein
MAYAFEPSIKGRVTEQLLTSLLDSAGYRVIPVGIEHSIQQLKTLAHSEVAEERRIYARVNAGLRKLPDFLVLDLEDSDWAPAFVEVKFRKRDDSIWTDGNLHACLHTQVCTWRVVYVVFFLGIPYGRGLPGHQPHAATNKCRVFRATALDNELRFSAMTTVAELCREGDLIAAPDLRWWHGVALERFFTRLRQLTAESTIRKATLIAGAVARVFREEEG